MSFTTRIATVVALAFAQPAFAQAPPGDGPSVPAPSLDSLVASALATHPDLQAAGDRVAAAQGRVSPAGALPDPVLSVGFTQRQNGDYQDNGADNNRSQRPPTNAGLGFRWLRRFKDGGGFRLGHGGSGFDSRDILTPSQRASNAGAGNSIDEWNVS